MAGGNGEEKRERKSIVLASAYSLVMCPQTFQTGCRGRGGGEETGLKKKGRGQTMLAAAIFSMIGSSFWFTAWARKGRRRGLTRGEEREEDSRKCLSLRRSSPVFVLLGERKGKG